MTTRDRLVVVIVVFAGLIAAGWFFVIAPQRDEATSLAGQVDALRATRDAAINDLQAGLAAKASYARDYATVARLGTAVPDDDNVASLLVQLERAAKAAKIDFRAIQVGNGSSAATPPPAPPTTDAAATQATTATLPPGATVGAAGFPTMPFSFTFTGNFFTLSDYVGQLERFLVVRNRNVAVSGRFMAIDGIAFNAASSGFPRIRTSIAATTYLVPPAQGLTAGATPSGPAGAAGGSTDPASGQTASSGSSKGAGIPTAAATPVAP